MEKVRVYEIAKELNISSKKLVQALRQVGIEVRSHMSTLEPEVSNQIRAMLLCEVSQEIIEESQKKEKIINNQQQELKQDVNTTQQNSSSSSQLQEINKQSDKEKNSNMEKKTPTLLEEKNNFVDIPDELKSDYTIIKHSKSVEEIWEEEIAKEKVKTSNRRKKAKRNKSSRNKQDHSKPNVVEIPAIITVGELAKKIKVNPAVILSNLLQLGIMSNINQAIDPEAAILIGEELGVKLQIEQDKTDLTFEVNNDTSLLEERPPIVTVMGHVDHGKTSLLDRIRNSRVLQTEAGGITQHIGAYQTEVNGKKITFLDTPGHAAFTAMRARGAQVTDIVILVVAADDGIMPQTIEAINHSKAAEVPIIVAINKCDKPDANPDRVKQELTKYNLVPEEWGGNTICVNISALTGENIAELLEAILLVAEMSEFKANPDQLAKGIVIESRIAKGQGRVATVIIQNGTIAKGDSFVIGNYYGKVKTLTNDKGRRVKFAGPSTPVLVSGLDGLPEPGEIIAGFGDDKEARNVADLRLERARQEELKAKSSSKLSLEELFAKMQDENETHTLNIIIKADVQGSVEAIKGSISNLNDKDTRIKFEIIHSGVGPVNESDVMLASASEAFIFGFNVNADSSARKFAEESSVETRFYSVIYNLLEDLESLGKGMLEPEYEEVVIGSATVRATFKVPKVGTIAGCYVTEGVIKRNSIVRLFRQGVKIFEGNISSLKRFKDDAKEVASGYECGIGLEKFNDIKEEDVIEAYEMKEKVIS